MAVNTKRLLIPIVTATSLVLQSSGWAAPAAISIRLETNNAIVHFTGELQTAANVAGPYTNVRTASPYIWPVSTAANRLWRARVLGITTFSARERASMAIALDGVLHAWGDNEWQTLGAGSSEMNVLTPIPVLGTQGWASVSCGIIQQLGLKVDGSLWEWGYGLGTEPRRVGVENNWMAIACGAHRLAVKSDGSLWAWGINLHGEMGIGTNDTASHPVPVRVGTDNDWVTVAAGWYNSVGIKADGSLWAWGDNDDGVVTGAQFVSTNRPTRLGNENDWVSVSCGFKPKGISQVRGYAVALKTNGTLWACGWNSSGQLGIGSQEHTNSFTQVGVDADWVAASCGTFHTVAVKTDGTLWGWGNASRLGITNVSIVTQPAQLGPDNDWIAVACGSLHTIVQKRDGTLWAWGTNDSGELGDGTQEMRRMPVALSSTNRWAQ
jgi:alpha-tubulin suppressor-like RCC1 family protein